MPSAYASAISAFSITENDCRVYEFILCEQRFWNGGCSYATAADIAKVLDLSVGLVTKAIKAGRDKGILNSTKGAGNKNRSKKQVQPVWEQYSDPNFTFDKSRVCWAE